MPWLAFLINGGSLGAVMINSKVDLENILEEHEVLEKELLKDKTYIALLKKIESIEEIGINSGELTFKQTCELKMYWDKAHEMSKSHFSPWLERLATELPELMIEANDYYKSRHLPSPVINSLKFNLIDKSTGKQVPRSLEKEFRKAVVNSVSEDRNTPLTLKTAFAFSALGCDSLAAEYYHKHRKDEVLENMRPVIDIAKEKVAFKTSGSKGADTRHKINREKKEYVRKLAKEYWNDEYPSGLPRIGIVIQWIQEQLHSEGVKPPAEKILREWIGDIAPLEARRGGRPKKTTK